MEKAFGTWKSPITAGLASGKTLTFGDIVLEKEAIYWSEMRPEEGGRTTILKWTAKEKIVEMLPASFNARTRVHEYGGASFTVHEGILYFTNYADQRVYRLTPGQAPVALTSPNLRFAEMQMSPFGLLAIGESHQYKDEVENFLALIEPHSGELTVLASGHDFYAGIALTKDAKKIAFMAWDHPNMPWDNTQLYIGDFSSKGITNLKQIDKEYAEQSFFQPTFSPKGELTVVSDKSNWWNLYSLEKEQLIPLFKVESDIGQPLWQLGVSRFAFYEDDIVCAFEEAGKTRLFILKDSQVKPLDLPYSQFTQIRTKEDKIVCFASAPDKATALICIDKQKQVTVIRQSTDIQIDAGYISAPKHIVFPSGKNRESYAYFYPPQNKDYVGLKNTLPPLIVKSHGGPTASCDESLNLEIQYWTSRGFAFVDVNYAGSSGYGRAYRKLLEGNWGIFDVEDCEAVALFLAKEGLVDKNKLAITGRSAGGYTTLAALTFTPTFHVGASLYGVSDLVLLTQETHKFESHYLEKLLGPYPEADQVYLARSPSNHVDKLRRPVIFFQGDEDKVVPPNQAENLYLALKEKGIQTKYCLFQGEQHGFRKAESRITVLEETLAFFLDVLRIKE